MSKASTTQGKSQRGPTVSAGGRARDSPPTASMAMNAGQRGSGSSGCADASSSESVGSGCLTMSIIISPGPLPQLVVLGLYVFPPSDNGLLVKFAARKVQENRGRDALPASRCKLPDRDAQLAPCKHPFAPR